MSSHRRFSAIALEEIPFGSRVVCDPQHLTRSVRLAPSDFKMDGVARRQWGVGDKVAYAPGEIVDVETEGSILVVDERQDTRLVQLHRGKIIG